MASALGSLLANYTDSEGEEDMKEEEEEENRISDNDSMDLNPTLAERLTREGTPNGGTPTSSTSGKSRTENGSPVKTGPGGTPIKSVKSTKLVSYNDPDAGLSDEEREPVPMELESDEEDKENQEENDEERVLGEMESISVNERSHIMEELWVGGVKLPPEPPGQCSKDLQDKIEAMYRRKTEDGYDYNRIIKNKKQFRNPSIYEKLIQFCDIDELGTNFPPELYDGHLFGKESYYEELAKVQKVEMDKREKALEAKKKLGDNRLKAESQQQHRKSKWDQAVPPGANRGAIGTVIPAFGSLKKK